MLPLASPCANLLMTGLPLQELRRLPLNVELELLSILIAACPALAVEQHLGSEQVRVRQAHLLRAFDGHRDHQFLLLDARRRVVA